ncbi:hypothetical protein FF125_08320 [Aureibaculum algae]|uniref:Uncharacterized protein n=1 Tax=Aureibaculum algae TaxID=2584122 RepID=A0A5B7TT70_9FLAO|nr:hypothetical protein [Aureibaculum algae]QCX38433.1 hypothetical protein FF125_08320 [Aureibaculum algae]
MSKTFKIVLAILVLISGWFMIGIGYTTKMGHPTSTFLFLFGMACFFIGCIGLLRVLKATKKS